MKTIILLLGCIVAVARCVLLQTEYHSLSVTTMSPAKPAEPIVMRFGMLTWMDPRNHALDGGPDPHAQRGNFEGKKGPDQDMPGYVRRSIYSK